MKHIEPSIAAIAFGLLLALAGHDALMAADPHRSPHTAHHTQAEHHAPMAAGRQGSADGAHHGQEQLAPDPATDCGLTTGAQVQPPAVPDPGLVGDPVVVVPDAGASTGFVPGWSVVPDHPPNIRRALLQVYLN